jgi:gamma-glutamyl-gamma-aminobutyrate hydrolase PuuD
MSRPIIGITSELDAARWGQWIREAVVSPLSYTRAVDRAGGAPAVLPPVPPDSARAFVAGLSGIIFTGGRDLDPALYEQARHEETEPTEHRRDRFELTLMRAAIDADVPFLAIGRGMHVLTVARGGTLTQHLPGHRPDALRYLPHEAALDSGSTLAAVLGSQVVAPASHHQAPDSLGEGLIVAGRSPDGDIVEALELSGHRFGVGVHWHPEEGDDPRLITALVDAATAFAAARPTDAQQPQARDVQSRKVQQKAKAAARRG